MLFTGTYERTVDEKLRIAIPKRLREAVEGQGGAFYIAPGTDGSLALYTPEGFARLSQRLAEAPPTQKDVRAFSRMFFSQAEVAEIDRQGRIRVPARLAEMAALKKEVILLGIHDHLELWDRKRWFSYREERVGHYDAIAEAAFRQGVVNDQE